MTRISNKLAYPLDVTISDEDYVIGTDADNLGKITKNFSVGNLREYIVGGLSPEIGGTLRISQITYTGVLTTPESVVNALDPDYEVLAYHNVFVKVNGQQFLLKLQDRFIGAGQDPVLNSDFIEFPISVGPQGEQGEQGIQGIQGEIGINWRGNWVSGTIYDPTDAVFFNGSSFICTENNFGSQAEDPETDTARWDLLAQVGNDGADGTSVVASGISTSVSGIGSELDPYIVETVNLQKTIDSFPYTLLSADNKHTIFVNNGASNVVIDVTNSLTDNFACVFIQKGTGTVTINATGTAVINKPTGLEPQIKGRYYWVLLEKDGSSVNYYLGGSLAVTP